MADPILPVTEDELHAYVDGELSTDRRAAVEAWIGANPDAAAQVATWRVQADAIRARYGGIAGEPIPHSLHPERLLRGTGRRLFATAAVAAFIAFVAGVAVGWTVRDASVVVTDASEKLATEALNAHKLYIAEVRHPIEVKADEKHLLPWLSRRVGTSLRAPDLRNYGLTFLGGRLLPGPHGPAALFMYEGQSGERFTLYSSPEHGTRSAFRYNIGDKFAAVHWIENGIGFVLSGPADRERLGTIAHSAYEQMELREPTPRRSQSDQIISRRGS